jgi:hypothetical protein
METALKKTDQSEAALVIQTPDTLMAKAIESGASIETLEKLMALQEKWLARQAKAAFDEALSKFQSIVPAIKKNKKGYDNTYSYAELDKIVEVIKAPLYECGFSYKYKFRDLKKETPYTIEQIITVAQAHDFEKKKLSQLEKVLREIITDKDIEVTCILTHKQGHSEETTMTGPVDYSGFKNAIQSRGSSTTYLERYTLIGALGLVTADTDNDGGKKEKEGKKPPVNDRDMSDSQFKKCMKWMQSGVNPDNGKKEPLTIEQIEKHFDLSEERRKALEIIEQSKKKP